MKPLQGNTDYEDMISSTISCNYCGGSFKKIFNWFTISFSNKDNDYQDSLVFANKKQFCQPISNPKLDW
jgi:hypothetical protein